MAGLAASFAPILDALGVGADGPAPRLPDALWAVALASKVAEAKAVAAVDRLRDAGLIEPGDLADAGPAEVAEAAGLPADSSALPPLLRLARWVADLGGADALSAMSTDAIRDALAAARGIGPSLAESILLRALGRPAYSVDRATYRVLVRHAWIEPDAAADEVGAEVVEAADREPSALRAFADAMERVGSRFCKPAVAKCDRCPLAPLLPEGGPRGGE